MKLKKVIAAVLATVAISTGVASGQVVVTPNASQTFTVKGVLNAAPAGAVATATVACKNLINGGQQTAIVTFSGNGEAALPFPFTAPSATVPTGTNCRIDVSTTPWNAAVELDVAEITHSGVAGVNTVSWKYPSGWFPVYGSTSASLRVTYPSVTVESQVVNWNFINASYRVDAYNGSAFAGSVVVNGVDNSKRTFTLADFPSATPSSTFNVTVINSGGTSVPVTSVSGVQSGGTAKLTFIGSAPVTTSTAAPTTTVASTTTTAAPVTTTVAPTTTTVVKTVVKCYRKVGKKLYVVKCPK